MDNFSTQAQITRDPMDGTYEHYDDGVKIFGQNYVLVCGLYGSQNYGLATETSDVDTNLIVIPSLRAISHHQSPVSTTHVRENNEHINFKDIRLFINNLMNQSLANLELLFSDYVIGNSYYQKEWQCLIDNREAIAHYNPYKAIKAMIGIAYSEYKQMLHCTEGRVEVFEKYQYDPKAYMNLCRVNDFIYSYLADKPYKECMVPEDRDFLLAAKRGAIPFAQADYHAKGLLSLLESLPIPYSSTEFDGDIKDLLGGIQYDIIKKAVWREINDDC